MSNGKVTETEYFNFLITEMDVRGSVLYRHIDGDPLKVAKQLSRELDSDKKAVKAGEIEALSSTWIVVDSDEFRNLAAAEREATTKGVRLAISNPCLKYGLSIMSHHARKLLHRRHNVRKERATLVF